MVAKRCARWVEDDGSSKKLNLPPKRGDVGSRSPGMANETSSAEFALTLKALRVVIDGGGEALEVLLESPFEGDMVLRRRDSLPQKTLRCDERSRSSNAENICLSAYNANASET